MKCTGIVRKLDDLGRIVIPKEIRRTFEIAEGDPIEIYTDGDCIVLKKFETGADIKNLAERLKSAVDKADCSDKAKSLSTLLFNEINKREK